MYRYRARLGPTWLPDAQSICPSDRRARPLEDLAERPRVGTFWRLGRETETVEDSTKTAEGHGCLADGRSSP